MAADADAAALSSLNPTSANSATALTERQVSRFAAIALLCYPPLLIGPIRSTWHVVPAWWTIVALTALLVPSAAMFVSTYASDARWTRRAAWAVTIVYAAISASFPLVWNGLPTSNGSGGWIAAIAGVVAVAAAIAMPIPASILYLVVAGAGTRFISSALSGQTSTAETVTDIAWGLTTAAIPFLIAVVALETGRLLDLARARANTRATRMAAEQSRRRESAALDAITHDRVMSIVWAASRAETSSELQEQAIATLGQLDDLRHDDDVQRFLSPAEVLQEFASAAALVDADVPVKNDAHSPHPVSTYPIDVVRSMASAMSEALHNSVRHAGSATTRSVVVTMTEGVLHTEIVDNGVGFDEYRVPVDRMGIALSIRGRMEHLPGGSATITSRPGKGTRVALAWQRAT